MMISTECINRMYGSCKLNLVDYCHGRDLCTYDGCGMTFYIDRKN